MKKPIIIELTWIDAQSLDTSLLSIEDLEGFQDGFKAFITGYLVKETKDSYYIAKEWWETGQFKYVHIVPKRSVIKKAKVSGTDKTGESK